MTHTPNAVIVVLCLGVAAPQSHAANFFEDLGREASNFGDAVARTVTDTLAPVAKGVQTTIEPTAKAVQKGLGEVAKPVMEGIEDEVILPVTIVGEYARENPAETALYAGMIVAGGLACIEGCAVIASVLAPVGATEMLKVNVYETDSSQPEVPVPSNNYPIGKTEGNAPSIEQHVPNVQEPTSASNLNGDTHLQYYGPPYLEPGLRDDYLGNAIFGGLFSGAYNGIAQGGSAALITLLSNILKEASKGSAKSGAKKVLQKAAEQRLKEAKEAVSDDEPSTE